MPRNRQATPFSSLHALSGSKSMSQRLCSQVSCDIIKYKILGGPVHMHHLDSDPIFNLSSKSFPRSESHWLVISNHRESNYTDFSNQHVMFIYRIFWLLTIYYCWIMCCYCEWTVGEVIDWVGKMLPDLRAYVDERTTGDWFRFT